MNEVFIPKQLQRDDFRFLKIRVNGKEPTADMGGWQHTNFKFNDEELLSHLKCGGNYAIIGGYSNLILIDADSEEVNNICKSLPETFTIKTGSPESYKNHYFYLSDKPVKPIRLSEANGKIGGMGDVRSVGQYVVAANSIHPSGGIYIVSKDIPITNIKEEIIRDAFKTYIDPSESTEIKTFPISTELRSSPYIKNCKVPDFVLNNKLKSGSSKNWKLFPYVVDIMYNRQANQEAYKVLAKMQGHQLGAVSGWVKLAQQGKIAKTSCKKMRDCLERFHPDISEEVCENCKLYQKTIRVNKITEAKNLNELQKMVLTQLALKEREEATEMIVEHIKKNNFIYSTRDDIKSEMWIYKDGVYLPQGKTFVKEFCRKILEKAFTTQIVNLVIAKIESDTYIDQDEFFSANYKYEVPVENGILNIITKELLDFDPKKIFFNKLPIIYDEYATCENIKQHFETVLKNKDDVIVMFEIFGFLLLKEYMIEKAFMLVGKGRNGKSKTLEIMKRFVGTNNCSAVPLKALHEESFSLSELFGKMANIAADLSNTDLKETGMIKSLIGRDTIQAKRKFLRDLNFVNYGKMVFAANELPKIYDTTDGFWTKWVLLEFPYKFITQKEMDKLEKRNNSNEKLIDINIIDKITTPEEMSGLLNKALESLDNILNQKDFSYSKGTQEVKELWIRQSDSFTAFCIDHIEEEDDSKISKKILRKVYHKYCKKHKIPGTSDLGIKITLQNNYGAMESRDYGLDRYWEGIKLK